jgi:hypothetical protein
MIANRGHHPAHPIPRRLRANSRHSGSGNRLDVIHNYAPKRPSNASFQQSVSGDAVWAWSTERLGRNWRLLEPHLMAPQTADVAERRLAVDFGEANAIA